MSRMTKSSGEEGSTKYRTRFLDYTEAFSQTKVHLLEYDETAAEQPKVKGPLLPLSLKKKDDASKKTVQDQA